LHPHNLAGRKSCSWPDPRRTILLLCSTKQGGGRLSPANRHRKATPYRLAAVEEICCSHAACDLFASQFHGHESVTFSRISV
jgi:hypothetical protein